LIKKMLSLSDLTLLKADPVFKKSVLPLLEKNQIIDAKVLQLISPSKAELLIMGKKVLADTLVPLTKGDTIQLKVSEQGKLNILKVVPERVNQNAHLSKLAGSTKVDSLPSISDSALQLFVKNQPFEGFTKLAAALFPDLKQPSVLTKEISSPARDTPVSEKKSSASAKDASVSEKKSPAPARDTLSVRADSSMPNKADRPVASDRGAVSRSKEQVESDRPVLSDRGAVSHLREHVAADKPVASDRGSVSLAEQPKIDKTDIRTLLTSVALKSEKADVSFLPRLLEKSGILMERKLSDLVKNSLETSSEPVSVFQAPSSATDIFSNTSPTQPLSNPATIIQEDIKAAILNYIGNAGNETGSVEDIHMFKEFIQNLENVQLLNSHLSESGKYIIPFPILSADQLSFGQLLIDLGENNEQKSSSKENSILKVSLFLEMTNLGPIRADFSVLKENITGGFQVSDKETASFFKLMLPELKDRLQIHGYNVHRIECNVVEPERLAEKSIIKELLKSEDHGFSVMI